MAELLQLRGVGHHAGPRVLFSGVDLLLGTGDRLGLVGPNGSGKSTLMHILGGDLIPLEGERSAPRGVRAGFVAQEPDLDPDLTVFESLMERL